MTFAEWKDQADAYAKSEYALPEGEIPDDFYRPGYEHGHTPSAIVDCFAKKYDLVSYRDFTLPDALKFMGDFLDGKPTGWA